MTWVFLAAAAIAAWTFAGYPLAMALLARLRPNPPMMGEQRPTIDALLVVHNAGAQVVAKIDNLLRQDYPAECLRVTIYCDGCDDDTEALARTREGARVQVLSHPARRGKSACIADALPCLGASVVLFTDVRQQLDPSATRRLVATLADPEVGAATGELVLQPGSGFARGIDAYWRYEKLLRGFETASGSIVGATGALYAVERVLLRAPPAGLVLDDMWIPLAVAEQGYRVVSVRSAIAHDVAASDRHAEQRRKRRTLAGNYQLLHLWPALAIPGRHPLAMRLWGHKWLRLLAPWCLAAMLASNALLAFSGETKWHVALALQLVAYALACAGMLRPALADRFLPVRVCAAFLSLNLSAVLGLFDYLRNPKVHLWNTSTMQAARR